MRVVKQGSISPDPKHLLRYIATHTAITIRNAAGKKQAGKSHACMYVYYAIE
jgi:hypothetical protein